MLEQTPQLEGCVLHLIGQLHCLCVLHFTAVETQNSKHLETPKVPEATLFLFLFSVIIPARIGGF